MKALSLIILVSIFLTACSPAGREEGSSTDENAANIEMLENKISELETQLNDKQQEIDMANEVIAQLEEELDTEEMTSTGPVPGASLLQEAASIVHLLKEQDFTALSLYIDVVEGLRVTPYQYVDTGSDIVLSQTDVANLASYPVTTWGSYDGTGDPIILNGLDYFDKFIYDEDYETAPYIGQNVVLSYGNIINNISDVYVGDSFVEFYFDGFNPAYSGMDWSSLTLVMRNIGGQWYLVGIVNGQWTI